MKKNFKRTIILIAMLTIIACPASAFGKTGIAKYRIGRPTVTSVKQTDYFSVKVSWRRVAGVRGYQVYKATSRRGAYRRVAVTRKKYFVDHRIDQGKTYYYRVKAFKWKHAGRRSGRFSNAMGITTVVTPPNLDNSMPEFNTDRDSQSNV